MSCLNAIKVVINDFSYHMMYLNMQFSHCIKMTPMPEPEKDPKPLSFLGKVVGFMSLLLFCYLFSSSWCVGLLVFQSASNGQIDI